MLSIARTVRTLHAFRASVESFTRIIAGTNRTLLLIGNASGGNFEVTSPELAAALLDEGEKAWGTGLLSAPQGLTRLFMACEGFIRSSSKGSADEADQVAGWLSAVCVEADRVYAQWVGGDEIWLLAPQGLLHRTRGHIKQYPVGLRTVDFFTTGLGSGYSTTQSESLVEPWAVEPGQRLLMMNRTLVRNLNEEDAVRLVMSGGVEEAVQALVSSLEHGVVGLYAAAIVAEF